MPSPFPGMDPYLENPTIWPNVHHGLISELESELNKKLRPRYFAGVEERVYLSGEDDTGRTRIVPDVHILAGDRKPGHPWAALEPGVATIEPVEVTVIFEEEIREAFVQIVDADDRAIVAVIEVLSPTNKTAGSPGRESYQKKRRQVLFSTPHLVEIDLLRAGTRSYYKEKLRPCDYVVHVSRNIDSVSRRSLAWPIPMTNPLPMISIPLRESDPHVEVNLQELLARAYERGAFDLKIDYSRDPVPPLTASQAEWAKKLISKATSAETNVPVSDEL